MSEPFSPDDELCDVDIWLDALLEAFLNHNPHPLKLAEQAVRQFPADAHVLNLASVAALLEGRPDRCLRFAKRLKRRYVLNNADHLLRALALSQQGRRGAAREILERQHLADFNRAWPWLPGGQVLRPWLRDRLAEIGGKARTSARERECAALGKWPGVPRRRGKSRRARPVATQGSQRYQDCAACSRT